MFIQELEELQANVDKAAEELEEKIRQYDQARDYELDTIEFEKHCLKPMIFNVGVYIFIQELEELQANVDKAAEELDEKIRQYDQARDYELDTIEFEKDSLQERQRQDR